MNVWMTTIYLILTIAAIQDLKLHHIDIKIVFLNDDLEE